MWQSWQVCASLTTGCRSFWNVLFCHSKYVVCSKSVADLHALRVQHRQLDGVAGAAEFGFLHVLDCSGFMSSEWFIGRSCVSVKGPMIVFGSVVLNWPV